jgi:hypothetical protein
VVKKKNKQRIFLSWLLLTFFAAGQVIVYSHQHHISGLVTTRAAHQSSHQTISDKCQLCDAMHANHIVLTSQVYALNAPVNYHFFLPGCYDFVSISLILSPGRAPPVS